MMNYRRDFEKCLEYIEKNITMDLNSGILAEYTGYSLFHFCRLFQVYKGASPMEYVRRRKLELSFEIPSGLYAVFTTPPVDMRLQDDSFANIIKATWTYIFDQWFETSEFAFDDSRYEFEFYDERCHYLENSVMNIYVPIKIAI